MSVCVFTQRELPTNQPVALQNQLRTIAAQRENHERRRERVRASVEPTVLESNSTLELCNSTLESEER